MRNFGEQLLDFENFVFFIISYFKVFETLPYQFENFRKFAKFHEKLENSSEKSENSNEKSENSSEKSEI